MTETTHKKEATGKRGWGYVKRGRWRRRGNTRGGQKAQTKAIDALGEEKKNKDRHPGPKRPCGHNGGHHRSWHKASHKPQINGKGGRAQTILHKKNICMGVGAMGGGGDQKTGFKRR